MSLKRLAAEKKARLAEGSAIINTTSSAAIDRIKKDLNNLDGLDSSVAVDNSNLYTVFVKVTPKSGIWRGGVFNFKLQFSDEYPYMAPKVRYTGPKRLFHPNIEGDDDRTEWGVCLNLQTEWTPSLAIRDIVFQIQLLFLAPTYDDPLPGVAKVAAQMLKNDPGNFEKIAQKWMKGEYTI